MKHITALTVLCLLLSTFCVVASGSTGDGNTSTPSESLSLDSFAFDPEELEAMDAFKIEGLEHEIMRLYNVPIWQFEESVTIEEALVAKIYGIDKFVYFVSYTEGSEGGANETMSKNFDEMYYYPKSSSPTKYAVRECVAEWSLLYEKAKDPGLVFEDPSCVNAIYCCFSTPLNRGETRKYHYYIYYDTDAVDWVLLKKTGSDDLYLMTKDEFWDYSASHWNSYLEALEAYAISVGRAMYFEDGSFAGLDGVGEPPELEIENSYDLSSRLFTGPIDPVLPVDTTWVWFVCGGVAVVMGVIAAMMIVRKRRAK